jgi:hypothetical protein
VGPHNYGDVSRFASASTEAVLRWVPGEVWLTETGGLVRFQMRDGTVPWPYDEQRAARSMQYAFDLADRHQDRITRMYVYNWRAVPHLRWDSGLLSQAGEPRPSFNVLMARLRPGQPAIPPTLAAQRRRPRPYVIRRPRYRHRDGRVLATVRCPQARRLRCTVVMAVRTKGPQRRRGTRVRRPRPAARGLLGEVSVRIRAGGKRVVKVRVPRARQRLIRLGRTRRLKAQLWLGAATPRQYDVRCRPRSRRR